MMDYSGKTDCAGTLARHFYKALRFSDPDAELLRLSVRPDASPGGLSSLYAAMDFDALDAQQACALSVLSRRLGFRGVPEDLVPRVQGVFRYHSALNAARMKELHTFLHGMNGAGARVTLLDGAAMKAYYLPEAVRRIADFRLLIGGAAPGDVLRAMEASGEDTVPQGDAANVPAAGKYTVSAAPGDGCTLVVLSRGRPPVRFFCRFGNSSGPDRAGDAFRDRAAETAFLGERVFIPSREALLLHLLSGAFQAALSGDEPPSGRIQWALDCAFLLREDGFGMERFRDLCRRTESGAEIPVMLTVLRKLFPVPVPEETFSAPVLSAAERKRIPLLLRYFRAEEKSARRARDDAGKRKSLMYCFRRLRVYWYRNRCLGKRSGLTADLLSFPACLRTALGAGSGRDLIRFAFKTLTETV